MAAPTRRGRRPPERSQAIPFEAEEDAAPQEMDRSKAIMEILQQVKVGHERIAEKDERSHGEARHS